MRGDQSNQSVKEIVSPDSDVYDMRETHNNHLMDKNKKLEDTSEIAYDNDNKNVISPIWVPKFMICLTNKEKEQDFLLFKASKLPPKPKRRTKFLQSTINQVSPGTWLNKVTMERYEVREKKISKKIPRGLKAMCSMESDSE